MAGGCLILAAAAAIGATIISLAPLPQTPLADMARHDAVPLCLDRHGIPLSRSYQTRFNAHDQAALHDIPDLLIKAFVTAEDARFFSHNGIDWTARFHALWQNMQALHRVRGASTISEQVVRIIFPRPRTYWSRWLEGWDAMRLERHCSKVEILEFYLNQVPFSASRRGIVQAARYYFGRAPDTLNAKETLALAAMVRAPSLLDPLQAATGLDQRIAVLAEALLQQRLIAPGLYVEAMQGQLTRHKSELAVRAPHFTAFARDRLGGQAALRAVRTTLDAELQKKTQELLEQRIADLAAHGLRNGAVLVVDHTTSEVLIWAVAGEIAADIPEAGFDAVRIPRQPGSTLKPFVYALALDKGWSPATVIKDEPIVEAVEHGLHVYRNFSDTYHGRVALAEALGNSLNTPAIRTLDFVGLQTFYASLQHLGMTSLTAGTATYGNGLVLGNAEISLLELVQAYGALARGGVPMRVKVLAEEDDDSGRSASASRVFSANAARTIGMILANADFRRLEFGHQSILNFPVRTAVKTGTSTRANDVWTAAYDGRFVVGIWLGNLDRSAPTAMMTGVSGPALLARSIFAELRRHYGLHPLPTVPWAVSPQAMATAATNEIRMVVPTMDMEVVLDPRIPKGAQAIPFFISGLTPEDTVHWIIDGRQQEDAGSSQPRLLWPVVLGEHQAAATVVRASGGLIHLPARSFVVR